MTILWELQNCNYLLYKNTTQKVGFEYILYFDLYGQLFLGDLPTAWLNIHALLRTPHWLKYLDVNIMHLTYNIYNGLILIIIRMKYYLILWPSRKILDFYPEHRVLSRKERICAVYSQTDPGIGSLGDFHTCNSL